MKKLIEQIRSRGMICNVHVDLSEKTEDYLQLRFHHREHNLYNLRGYIRDNYLILESKIGPKIYQKHIGFIDSIDEYELDCIQEEYMHVRSFFKKKT